jgi:Resolvase, N terminal domain
MVKALEPGTLVIASKLDRIFRSASDALKMVEEWKRRGIDLVLPDCGTDPVSSNGNSNISSSSRSSPASPSLRRVASPSVCGKAAAARKSAAVTLAVARHIRVSTGRQGASRYSGRRPGRTTDACPDQRSSRPGRQHLADGEAAHCRGHHDAHGSRVLGCSTAPDYQTLSVPQNEHPRLVDWRARMWNRQQVRRVTEPTAIYLKSHGAAVPGWLREAFAWGRGQ